jgi:drug/metabolite transporter (DMT)-like permease
MSLFLTIAISAYMLFALNGIADKFLLTRAIKHPSTYAFYSGVSAILILVLAPFFLKPISLLTFYVALIAGALFAYGLYFLYSAASKHDISISRLLPIEGGLVPLFTLILSYTILGERLSQNQLLAFGFLVIGAVLISIKYDRHHGWHLKAWKEAALAAVFFALSFVFTKYVYNQTPFLSGLIWTRMGLVIGAASFLLVREYRKHIFAAPEKVSSNNKMIFYGARISGGLGGFLQNYAISLGSVSIVNALQGTQFVFILILTSFISIYYPKILEEKITRYIIIQKIIAILLISFGLFNL